ncbi:hypothetical protein ScPMuIL_010315 [Solemya velum]
MTTTTNSIGMDDDQRPSSRVLAPPGGGSSNIFGAPDEPVKPRPAKHQSGSNIFAAAETKSPAKEVVQKKDDSKNKLFGPPSPPTPNSQKHRDESHNKLFGEPEPILVNKENHKRDSPQPVAAASTQGNKRGFNPITGLPYASPEAQSANQGSGDVTTQRNSSRVLNPPGGRSSGPLW